MVTDKESIDKLMLRRWIVIAEDTSGNLQVGKILTKHKLHDDWANYNDMIFGIGVRISTIEKMPHLFCELKWWEHREDCNMPNYAKSIEDNKIKYVHKIEFWMQPFIGVIGDDESINLLKDINLYPSTEEEYNSYIDTLKK